MDKLRFAVAEKFISINGEARRAGELSVFIRFRGCNLRCNYCDTLWACDEVKQEENCTNTGAECGDGRTAQKMSCVRDENTARDPGDMCGDGKTTHDMNTEYMTAEEIYGYIKSSGVKNVTLTGGEPMIQKGIAELLELLSEDKNLRTEIETNGAVPLEEYYGKMPDNISFTVDYKCPGSGMEKAMHLQNFEKIRNCDTVKFVVSDRADLEKMCEVISEYGLTEKCTVYVSAVFGRIEPREIVDYMIENKLNDVRLQLQIHKYVWDPQARGV